MVGTSHADARNPAEGPLDDPQNIKNPWICAACKSTVNKRSTPATSSIFATSFEVIGSLSPFYLTCIPLMGEQHWQILHWHASASTIIKISNRLSFTGRLVDCRIRRRVSTDWFFDIDLNLSIWKLADWHPNLLRYTFCQFLIRRKGKQLNQEKDMISSGICIACAFHRIFLFTIVALFTLLLNQK